MSRHQTLVTVVVASLAATVSAQTPSPSPGSGSETRWVRPEPVPPPSGTRLAKAPPVIPPANRGPASPYLGLRALSAKEGEMSLQTAEGRRTLRPGDRLGEDVVKAVDEGLLVLQRPAAPGRPGGEATVVVRFDAKGQPTVRVYHTEDKSAVEPWRVR